MRERERGRRRMQRKFMKNINIMAIGNHGNNSRYRAVQRMDYTGTEKQIMSEKTKERKIQMATQWKYMRGLSKEMSSRRSRKVNVRARKLKRE